jgi:hypothetical protein
VKLNYLGIIGFQGIEVLEVDKPNPVIVFSGPNACGKSTVRDAIQFALDGDSRRCKLKKDYGKQLVNSSATKKDAVITLELDNIEYQRKVATGNITGDEEPNFPALLPWLIGTESLATADIKDAQRVVMAASGVRVTRDIIKDRLISAGVYPKHVTAVMPFLRSGFPAGLKEAKSKVSGKRGEWKGITGEVYGSEKAETWTPSIEDAHKRLDAANIAAATARGKMEELTAKRDKFTKGMVMGGSLPQSTFVDIGPCPGCGVEIRKQGGKLYIKGEEPEPEAHTDPPAKGDTYESLDRQVAGAAQELGRAKANAANINEEIASFQAIADNAGVVHKELQEWDKLAKLLQPDGLAKTLIAEALEPINDRIAATCDNTGWPLISITDDLRVWYGDRYYQLASESEQWRANAAIAEALACISGVKIFALDRMDILAPGDRGTFIKWIDSVKPDHDTILIMATLKTEPKMPYGFTSVWLGE